MNDNLIGLTTSRSLNFLYFRLAVLCCLFNPAEAVSLQSISGGLGSGTIGHPELVSEEGDEWIVWHRGGRLYSRSIEEGITVDLTEAFTDPNIQNSNPSSWGEGSRTFDPSDSRFVGRYPWTVANGNVYFRASGSIYSVPLDGGVPKLLSGSLNPPSSFVVDQNTGDIYFRIGVSIYRGSRDGGEPTSLFGFTHFAISFILSPESQFIVFYGYEPADAGQFLNRGLYSVSFFGGTPVRLNNPNRNTLHDKI